MGVANATADAAASRAHAITAEMDLLRRELGASEERRAAAEAERAALTEGVRWLWEEARARVVAERERLAPRASESGAASSYAEIFATLRRAPALAFAGIGPRLIRIPAGLATMMAALEATKRAFELRTQRRRAEAAS